ncbi:acyl-CoA dehydrogenase family protein [Variovorax sp. J22P168]|uniref:acyl-CoA dehydrogenase family protein n=1 Tax=Variovorax jilinensis TaxID=3053513 RepID=UPI002578D105|nr:acyl-CoA dehydrogenase family protein [Variovorax sp. J22P168]MDM0015260.1 acyl-CoA dehydrogenase family protein [Variovorax sp. J22P168]
MDFELSDDQQQLAQSLDRVLRAHCSFEKRQAIAATDAGWSEPLWGQLAQLGVTALGIAERHGGLGGGAIERLPVLQAFGAVHLLEPYLATCVLGATAVQAAGSSAQQAALLPAVAEGRARLAWAHDEAATRHAPLWVQARARRDGASWRLTGIKSLVLGAAAATRWVVSARIEGEPDAEQGLALFLVRPDAAGVRLRSFRLVDDTPAGELALDDAEAEALGDATDSGCAAAAIRAVQAAGTAAACADMVGAMESAFALTTSYVNTRQQFGRAIGDYQAVRHRSADMAVALEMARSMAIAAAGAADDQDAPGAAVELARAKLVVGRHARALCEAAIQSHGGIGMTEEYAVGHCLRRVHVLDHLFGDVDAQAAALARLARPVGVD